MWYTTLLLSTWRTTKCVRWAMQKPKFNSGVMSKRPHCSDSWFPQSVRWESYIQSSRPLWGFNKIQNTETPSVAQMVKNLLAMRETWDGSLVGKIPWRRAWQSTPVLLPGESPWTEEPGGLQSMGLQRVRHDWMTKHRTLRVKHGAWHVPGM